MLAPAAAPGRTSLPDRMLRGALFLTLLLSPFVFVEPSPYEAAFVLLMLAFVAARVPIDRTVVPLILLLLVWNVSGIAALLPVLSDRTAVTFTVTSLYLAGTAVVFACIFAEDALRRLRIMSTAYVLAALIASAIGIAAYFHLLPNSEQLLLGTIRAKSTFKDPNVFGPFLILPLILLIERTLREGLRASVLAAILLLLFGLFLSFSRGAWANFLFAGVVLTLMLFVTAPTPAFRARILTFSVLAVAAMVALLALLLSIDAIDAVFEERASLLQQYDAGPSGRFGRQAEGALGLLEHPWGVGPLQFAKHFGQDPHNVYLNALASYGWIGGIAYLALALASLIVSFRAALARTPWQPYAIAVTAAFVGTTLEGLVIDTDHWRHYYLLLGAVWGLFAATEKLRRQSMRRVPRTAAPSSPPAQRSAATA